MTAQVSKTAQPAKQGQSLPAVLAQTFEARTDGAFAEKLVGLIAALVNTQPVYVFAPKDEELTILAGTARPDNLIDLTQVATRGMQDPEGVPHRDGPYLVVRVDMPSGGRAVAIVTIPPGSAVVQSLAHERVAVLQALASARYRNAELDQIKSAMAAAVGLSAPTPEALQNFADQIANLTEAQYAAIGQFDGSQIGVVAVSGQAEGTKRAALPDRLRRDMAEIGRKKLSANMQQFMGGAGQDHGLVMTLENPARNADLIPLIAAAVRSAAPAGRQKVPFGRRLQRWGIAALIVIGIAMIPLPDGVNINATVTSTNFRVVTAPYSAALVDIAVADNQRVVGGETPLGLMDTAETTNELIAAQADYAAALLERETARAGRDAAALRSAELEAQRIEARIALLESRREAATLIAPISGLVIGPDLQGQRGAVVSQGDILMQIADPEGLRLDVEVGQDALARITTGMSGRFRPDFDPSLDFEVDLTAVSPAALDTDRAPIFAARATFAQSPAQLRHGMTGVMAVDRQWRPAGLLLWDAIRDWVLLRLWL